MSEVYKVVSIINRKRRVISEHPDMSSAWKAKGEYISKELWNCSHSVDDRYHHPDETMERVVIYKYKK